MSYPGPNPTQPPVAAPQARKKPSRFRQAWNERLPLVALIIIGGLLTHGSESAFVGYVVLASIVTVPTVRWFFLRNKSTQNKTFRLAARIAAFVTTLTFFIVGTVNETVTDGFLYTGLIFLIIGFGWVKKEGVLAVLIFLSFIVFEETGNVIVFTAAIFITAGMLHKQWKHDDAIKAIRLEQRFDESDQSRRPSHLGHTGGGLADRTGYVGAPYADQHPTSRPYPGTETGVMERPAPGAAYDAALIGSPVQPPHQGDLSEEPAQPAPDGPPVRRRLVDPDAGGTSAG